MATSTTTSTTSKIMLQQDHEYSNTDDQQQQQHSLSPSIRLQPPTDRNTEERLNQIDELKYFLGTATNDWEPNRQVQSFPLPTGESLSCVFWNDLFHVTGTDIVRTLLYRFHLFGRPVTNLKKFEEGIFSDLRNLKPGMDASLEEPKSEFLEMLYKNNCIRTQKKQKVFYWFSVPHDRLFLDALERDLKREKLGLEPTSVAIAEPATSLSLDTTQELFDQLRKSMSLSAVAAAHAIDEVVIGGGDLINCLTTASNDNATATADGHYDPPISASHDDWSDSIRGGEKSNFVVGEKLGHQSTRSLSSIPISTSNTMISPVQQPLISTTVDQLPPTSYSADNSPESTHFFLDEQPDNEKQKIFGAFSLFEGSPTYKQRQRRRTLSFGQNEENIAAMLNNPHHLFQQSNSHHHHQEGPDKVYTCPLPQCARLFKRLEHLKRHFRTHTMERPYSCTMCGKHFSRTDNLAQHKKTHNRTRSSSVTLSRCNSNSKLLVSTSENDHSNTTTKTRKRATSLRNNHCNEIINKLSVLTSNDVFPPMAPPYPHVIDTTTTAVVPIDYFSYQGGDLSRCASTTSPSGSIPQSDEDFVYGYEYHHRQTVDDGGDICMTDDGAVAVMYDEEQPYDAYGPILPYQQSQAPSQPESTSSFMWQHNNIDIIPSCSTASAASSSLVQQQQYYQLSWYSSMYDKSVSPKRSSSPSSSPSSFYNNNEIYSWQQT